MELQQAPQNMVIFQNMIPGTPNSQLVAEFKKNCLGQEQDEEQKKYREQMTTNIPPILSFLSQKQMEEFYKKIAGVCEFCCGRAGLSAGGSDYYMYSMNNDDKLYQGKASEIVDEIKQDIKASAFGSKEQEQRMSGLTDFTTKVAERNQAMNPEMPANTQQQVTAPNPFKMAPKKTGE